MTIPPANCIELDNGDIRVYINVNGDDRLAEFMDRHIRHLITDNVDYAITYAMYMRDWYKSRGIRMWIKPSKQCGWIVRLAVRVLIWSIREQWDKTPDYASRWMDETMKRER